MLPSGLDDQAEFLTHSSKEWLSTTRGGQHMEKDHIRAGAKQKDHATCDPSNMSVLLSQGPAHPNRAITVFTHTSAWGNRTLAP